MEVPRPWVQLELDCQPMPQPQKRGILAASVTYTMAHGNAGSLIRWVRTRDQTWILVMFDTAEPLWELPYSYILSFFDKLFFFPTWTSHSLHFFHLTYIFLLLKFSWFFLTSLIPVYWHLSLSISGLGCFFFSIYSLMVSIGLMTSNTAFVLMIPRFMSSAQACFYNWFSLQWFLSQDS